MSAMGHTVSRRAYLLAAITLVGVVLCNAQAANNCPPISKTTATLTNSAGTVTGTVQEQGVLPGTTVDVQVVDTSNGNFTDGSDGSVNQVAQIGTAASNDVAALGSTATVTNTDTAPNVSGANASSPVAVVEYGTQSQIDALGGNCAGASACTQNHVDSNGFTTTSLTIMLPNVSVQSVLEQLMAHEFGHGLLGLSDVNPTAPNASQSVMDGAITDESATGPTDCDKQTVNPKPCTT